MKSLIVILLALFIFQASYGQGVEVEVEVEGEIGEVTPEEVPVTEAAGEKEWKTLNITQALLDYRYRNLFDFGEQLVISHLIGYDAISNSSTWQITKFNFVNYKPSETGLIYAINALFESKGGDSFTSEFVIDTRSSLNYMRVTAVSFTKGDDDVEDAALESAEEALENEDEIPVAVEAGPEGEPSESVVKSTWTVVSNQEAENDPIIKGYIDEGIKYAIKKGGEDGGINRAYGGWKQSSLDLVRKKGTEGTTYVFYVKLDDEEYQKAGAEIFVVENPDKTHFIKTTGIWEMEDLIPLS